MIRSRLGVLLAERRISAAKVSKDTGLSRNTLSLITTNAAKGIQYDTMNTLCVYLGVTPGELFLFIPFKITVVPPSLSSRTLSVSISDKGRVKTYTLELDITVNESPYFVESIGCDMLFPSYVYIEIRPAKKIDDGSYQDTQELLEYLKLTPPPILASIQREEIEYPIYREIVKDTRLDECGVKTEVDANMTVVSHWIVPGYGERN